MYLSLFVASRERVELIAMLETRLVQSSREGGAPLYSEPEPLRKPSTLLRTQWSHCQVLILGNRAEQM